MSLWGIKMQNNLFLSQIKNSSYLKRILDGKDVVLLYIAGSRLIDIIDERSDYDLVCLTNGGERIEHDEQYLTYDETKVHWSYVPITKLIGNENGSLMSCFGEVLFSKISDEAIIYQNEKYHNLIEYLKLYKTYVGHVGSYGLEMLHRELIERILQNNELTENNYCKFVYHICYASYYLNNEEPDKDFLIKIKRIRWQPVADKYKQKAVERIRYFKHYIDTHPIDLQNIIKAFNNDIARLLSSN